jgi:hypothetical protein
MSERINNLIIEVKALNDFMLYIVFENGERKVYDVNKKFENDNEFSITINNINLFKKVEKKSDGSGVFWNDEDYTYFLRLDDLYFNSKPESEYFGTEIWNIPKTSYVKPLENFKLYVEFENEEKRIFDVNILLSDDPIYGDKEEYKNLQLIPDLFNNVKVSTWGDGVEWKDENHTSIGMGNLYYYSVPYSEEIHGVIPK